MKNKGMQFGLDLYPFCNYFYIGGCGNGMLSIDIIQKKDTISLKKRIISDINI